MQTAQRPLAFKLERNRGESFRELEYRQKRLDGKYEKNEFTTAQLLAQMLKRQARQIMADVTHCDALQMPVHLARIRNLKEIFKFHLNHELKETSENVRSDRQLSHPFTLRDFLECLEITASAHRQPAFLNAHDEELQTIHRKLDMLAGHVAALNNENLCPSCRIRLAEIEGEVAE